VLSFYAHDDWRARRNLRALRSNQDKRLDAIAERAVEAKDLAPPAQTDR
jgi:hypothetical protein